MEHPPPDALCERCWSPLRPGQRAVRLAHIRGSTLTGDVSWAYTWLHYLDGSTGACELVAPPAA